jgi:RHS repeat-associated protein
MPKDLLAGDGAVAWSATHAAYGRVVATYADETARARYGTAINSPFRLLGQVADDDAELCFTRFRCFDPEVGSWISSDPLEIAGGLNLYGFDGAPTDVVDPLGLAGNKHDKGAKGGLKKDLRQQLGRIEDHAATPGNKGTTRAMTPREVRKLADHYLGPGARVANRGRHGELWLESADGKRLVRMPTSKASEFARTGKQANFHQRPNVNADWFDSQSKSNVHVNVKD